MKDVDVIREFNARHERRIVPHYEDREDRNRWAASVVEGFPGREVLNLGGGGKRHLGTHLGAQWSVHEIDVTGDCDTKLNLDEVDQLPFADGIFDTACAFEVLEHLEQFHLITQEMFRVTKSTIFISLPNAAVEAMFLIKNKKYWPDASAHGVYSKFYGLPLEVPEDRHRWWLSFEDIVRYFVHLERTQPCKVEFYIPNLEPTVRRKIIRLICGDRIFFNFFCTNVWIKIDKRGG